MAALGLIWLVLLVLWWAVDAAPLVILVLGLFTLPLAWEVGRNPVTRLTLGDGMLSWHSQFGAQDIPLPRIAHIRLDRRLDMSMRISAVLDDGRTLRLPQDVVPPIARFEQALADRGIACQRHPFSLLG